ncbi:MAG TPA: aminotransferase class IV [Spirochaetota bacterium]|nr:aminotransferase class IV [Spirochaetota bacterium]
MCRLVETIKIYNKRFFNLAAHQQRMNKSREKLFNCKKDLNLEHSLEIPATINNGLYKCRVIYDINIKKIEFLPYTPPDIKSVKIVKNNRINYNFKYLDRTLLKELFAQKGKCDDILIVKNNLVTDSYFANAVFFNGKNYLTPKSPLLPGTQREMLLNKGLIKTAEIKAADIQSFQYLILINALNGLNRIKIAVKNIYE